MVPWGRKGKGKGRDKGKGRRRGLDYVVDNDGGNGWGKGRADRRPIATAMEPVGGDRLTQLAGRFVKNPMNGPRFKIIKYLACGSFGAVYLVTNEDGVLLAIKVMADANDAKHEAKMLMEGDGLRHLMGYHGTTQFMVPDIGWCYAQFMDYYPPVDGVKNATLKALIGYWTRVKMPLEVDEALFLCHQIFLAIGELRSRELLHRDLKDENIMFRLVDPAAGLVPYNVVLVLTDMGLARILPDGSFSKSIKGTPCFMPPEMMVADENPKFEGYTADIEVFPIFVTFYKIFFFRLPWANSPRDIAHFARNEMYQTATNYEFNVEDQRGQLVRRVGAWRADGRVAAPMAADPLPDSLVSALAKMGDYHDETRMDLHDFLSCGVFNRCIHHPSPAAARLCHLLTNTELRVAGTHAKDRADEVREHADRLAGEALPGGGCYERVMASWEQTHDDFVAAGTKLQNAHISATDVLVRLATGGSQCGRLGVRCDGVSAATRFATEDEAFLEEIAERTVLEIEEMAAQLKSANKELGSLNAYAEKIGKARGRLSVTTQYGAVIKARTELESAEDDLNNKSLDYTFLTHDPAVLANECLDAIDDMETSRSDVMRRIDALERATAAKQARIAKTDGRVDAFREHVKDFQETIACLIRRARSADTTTMLLNRAVAGITATVPGIAAEDPGTSDGDGGRDDASTASSGSNSSEWGTVNFEAGSSWGSRSADGRAERARLQDRIASLEESEARLTSLVRANLETIDLLRETNAAVENDKAELVARVSVFNDLKADLGLKPARKHDRKACALVRALGNGMAEVMTAYGVSKRHGLRPDSVSEATRRAVSAADSDGSIVVSSDRADSVVVAGDAEA